MSIKVSNLCKWDERERFVICEDEPCLPSFSSVPKIRMSECFSLGLEERQWEEGHLLQIFLLFVFPTHTTTT